MSTDDGIVPTDHGLLHVTEDPSDDNPVVHHLSVFKTRARMVSESRVDDLAQRLQAAESYADWDSLSDGDKELWRHMARLELC